MKKLLWAAIHLPSVSGVSPAGRGRTCARGFLLCGVLLLLARYPAALASEVVGLPIQYTHTKWTDSVGLKGRVYSMAQTSDGYLWLGTEFGLVRFDGIRFAPPGPTAGPSLPGSIIWSLLAARDGSLWIGTLDGLSSWHQGQLIRYPELAAHPVFALLEDHEGTVWAGGTAGLCSIRGTKVHCSEIEGSLGGGLFYSNEGRGSVVYSLYEDGERHLWAGTDSGLWQWTPGPAHRYASQRFSAPQALVAGERGMGLIAITGAAERMLMRSAHDGLEEYTIPGVPQLFGAESALRDRHGALWVGTMEDGLLRVQDGTFSWPEEKSRLSGDFVSTLLEDREGSIWAGTTNGLDRFRESAVSTISADEGLSTPVGCVLAARDGSLWVGSYGGLNRWNRGQLTIYRATARPVRRSVSAEEPPRKSTLGTIVQKADRELPGNAIASLFEDPGGRIWVGTDDGTAWFENGRFHRVAGLPKAIWIAMFADARAGVWIGYPGSGLFRVVDGSVAESVAWPWWPRGPDPRLSALVSDPLTGGLWLGFLHGGVGYFKDRKLQTSFSSKQGLGSDTVWNLLIDHEGTLWAATEGGLSRIRDGRVTTLTRKNGMPCDSVKWVIEDDASSLWLNTGCGLVRIERTELNAWVADSQRSIHPRVFDRTDGVRMHALGAALNPVVTKSPDGRLWFVHVDGISTIDPLHLRINPVPPPVYIEQITADGQTYVATSGLHLPARLRDLTIDYTALSLAAPEKVRFQFKLEGQDPGWREVLNIRRVQYSNLAPGSYRFRVIAANNSGVWNPEGASLDFSIAPAYWQTGWFRAACLAATLLVLWALYELRMRQIARAFSVRLEERVAERTRIARELHDTLLQGFHGLVLYLKAAEDLFTGRPAEAKKMLNTAIQQGAKVITEGRNAVEGLRTSTQQDPYDLALAIRRLGESLTPKEAALHPIEFRVDVGGIPRPMQPIVRDELYRIAGEALRNAFHHSQATLIEVELRFEQWEFRLRVRDNGIGIDPEVLGGQGPRRHYGLRGMRERSELIGAKLTLWSALQAGTEVDLRVPAKFAYAPARAARDERMVGGRDRSEA